MSVSTKIILTCAALCLAASMVLAQSQGEVPESNVTTKSVKAIGYKVGGGSTKVDFEGTELMPTATGEAKVEAKTGATSIEVSLSGMKQPSTLGAEFLTYVLWVVTPDGRTGNTAEIVINKNGEAKFKVTTPAQTFAMIVTAEPYFAVRLPSEMVALENDTRKNTKGQIFPVNDFRLMKRAQYEKLGNPLSLTLDLEHVPLQMYEARNAVEIAKSRGAEKDAPEIFTKARAGLADLHFPATATRLRTDRRKDSRAARRRLARSADSCRKHDAGQRVQGGDQVWHGAGRVVLRRALHGVLVHPAR